MTLFDDMGGEPVLRGVIHTFVSRLVKDPLIGFFFRHVDVGRLEQKEYEHAAEHLGAGVAYTGKPLQRAHAPHRIMGGQFQRRLWLLRQVLEECQIPASVREHWLQHSESLEPLITGARGASCADDSDDAAG